MKKLVFKIFSIINHVEMRESSVRKNFRDSIKLFWPHIVVSLLMVGQIIGIVSLYNIRKQMEILYNETYIVNHAARSMNVAFEETRKSIFLVAVMDSQDLTNQEIANIKDNANILQEQISLIKQNFSEDSDIVARLEKNLVELVPMQDYFLNLAVQNNIGDASKYVENNNISVIKKAQEELELLIQSTDTKENNLFTSIQAMQRITMFLLLSLAIVSVLFSIVVISKQVISKGKHEAKKNNKSINIT